MAMSTVAVIGAGTMGAGIAQVALQSGCRTIVVEADEGTAVAADRRIRDTFDRLAERGRIEPVDRDEALARFEASAALDAAAEADLVIEAAVEDEAVKLDLFSRLDAIVPAATILATNTSSIPIVNLAVATGRPDRVLGVHFFNPAPVQPLVELVPAITTSEDTVRAVDAFATGVLGKVTIRAADRAGFVVNRLLVPYLLSAIRMLDEGVATRDDIDTGMKNGCAHPLGPLELCDLIGLDIVKAVADVVHDEFRTDDAVSPPLLNRMVAAGRLGRKTGSGFYDHT